MATRKTNGGSTTNSTRNTTPREKLNREGTEREAKISGSTSTRGTGANATKEGKVTVTFNVTVPESTHELKKSVFLTGTVHQLNAKLKDWDPRAQQMKKVDDRHWTVTWSGPAGAHIEYKYTLGDWDHVEQDANCNDTGNRQITIPATTSEPLNLEDTVQNWRGIGN